MRKPLKTKPLKTLALRGAALAAALAAATPAQAGTWWIFGDKIYNTGQVTSGDDEELARILALAKARGQKITTVVFRNNPGGVAQSGLNMAGIIRANGLNTIFQGGCYSACSEAYSGGVKRGMAQFDLPQFSPVYAYNTLGIHGGSINGVPASAAIQQILFDFMVSTFGSDLTPGAIERIRQAHFDLKDSNGFLRYFDPAVTTGPTTMFCPTGGWTSGNLTGCTNYDGVTLYSDGLVTLPGYTNVEDLRHVTGTVSGDLNPNFGLDLLKGDLYGAVKIERGGVWNLATTSTFFWTTVGAGGVINILPGGRLSPGGEVYVADGGVINLQGGTLGSGTREYLHINSPTLVQNYPGLDSRVTWIGPGGMITGSGGIADFTVIQGILAPTGTITIKPYWDQNEPITNGFEVVNLLGTSITAIQVSPTTTTAAIRNEKGEAISQQAFGTGTGANRVYNSAAYRFRMLTPVVIVRGASLSVNFGRGFYQAGQVVPLFEGYENTRVLTVPSYIPQPCTRCRYFGTEAALDYAALTQSPYFSGHFTNFIRGNDGAQIALDPTALSQKIDVGQDSLLGFDLVYTATPDVINNILGRTHLNNFIRLDLVARPAFENTAIFANAASGDSLGQALRTASYRATPGNAELLGALQFSSVGAATAASPVLRGDAHATQMLANQALVSYLDDIQFARIGDARLGRSGDSSGDPMALAAGADMAMNLLASGTDKLRFLVDGPAQADPGDTGKPVSSGWGKLFIGDLGTDAGAGVAGLHHEFRGATAGADIVTPGGAVFGGSFAYVASNAGRPASAYKTEGEALSASVYAGASYRYGDLAASLRVARIDNKTVRAVTGIGGLEAPVRGDTQSDDLSARFEHAVRVTGADDHGLRILVPTLSYQRSEAPDQIETGGAYALALHGKALESLRVGGGFDWSHSYRTRGRARLTPQLRIGYERETEDVTASLDPAFAAQPDIRFAVASQSLGRDIGRIDAGLSIATDDRFAVTVQYSARIRDGQEQHSGFFGVMTRF